MTNGEIMPVHPNVGFEPDARLLQISSSPSHMHMLVIMVAEISNAQRYTQDQTTSER